MLIFFAIPTPPPPHVMSCSFCTLATPCDNQQRSVGDLIAYFSGFPKCVSEVPRNLFRRPRNVFQGGGGAGGSVYGIPQRLETMDVASFFVAPLLMMTNQSVIAFDNAKFLDSVICVDVEYGIVLKNPLLYSDMTQYPQSIVPTCTFFHLGKCGCHKYKSDVCMSIFFLNDTSVKENREKESVVREEGGGDRRTIGGRASSTR